MTRYNHRRPGAELQPSPHRVPPASAALHKRLPGGPLKLKAKAQKPKKYVRPSHREELAARRRALVAARADLGESLAVDQLMKIWERHEKERMGDVDHWIGRLEEEWGNL